MTAFVRYGLGEGIEKPKDDFASEVAGMAKT
jgi:translation elongation factor EF-Ts